MLRTAAGLLLIAGVFPACFADVARAQSNAEPASDDGSALIDQTTLPSAVDLKGARPQADPSVLPPAATTLPESMESRQAPPSLALPDQTDQVRIRELRPLTLAEVERLAEVNNPNLKAVASQVQQAKSGLRAALARWYPTLDLSANGLPQYLGGEQQNFDQRRTRNVNSVTGETTPTGVPAGVRTTTSRWTANFGARLNWNLIDPGRVPEIAAARDTYERSREAYLIALRELR
ncbi:MAG: TolC family protein, partial [Cyanobacteriota bacterium]|nr:TolC family protein [Cyanobacteriota bacterium]